MYRRALPLSIAMILSFVMTPSRGALAWPLAPYAVTMTRVHAVVGDPSQVCALSPPVSGGSQPSCARRRSAAWSSAVAGPGRPSPMATPSSATMGISSRTEEDIHASSAVATSPTG